MTKASSDIPNVRICEIIDSRSIVMSVVVPCFGEGEGVSKQALTLLNYHQVHNSLLDYVGL